jgi:hypothetical protein
MNGVKLPMEITISKKFISLIDDEDAPKIRGFGLHVNSKGYVEIRWQEDGSLKSMLLHRLVFGECSGKMIDHINGNPLDNRKQNLRAVTRAENQQNSKLYKSNTTGRKGVIWHVAARKYNARIQVNGKRINLGYFDTAEEASTAYESASKKYHGQYARTNHFGTGGRRDEQGNQVSGFWQDDEEVHQV